MKTHRRLAALAVAALTCSAGTARGQESGAPTSAVPLACEAAPGAGVLIIDAATGRVDGRTRYDMRARPRIVAINLNPFRYAYTLASTDTAVSEPSHADVLRHIGIPLPADEDADAADPTPGAASRSAAETLTIAREELLNTARFRSSEHWIKAAPPTGVTTRGDLATAEDDARKAVAPVYALVRAYGTYVRAQQAILSQSYISCLVLLQTSDVLKQHAANVHPPFDGAELAIEALRRIRNQAAAETPDADVTSADATLASLTDRLETAQAAFEALTDVVNGIAAVAAGNGFTKTIYAGDFDLPTDSVVTLSRRDGTDAEATLETISSTKLNFGGRGRFTLAGGWGFAWLPRPAFARVQGHPVAQPGGDPDRSQLVPVIGLAENSDYRNGPLAMVHVRLTEISGNTLLHWSLGATPKSEDDELSIEYITGLSLGLAEGRFFVTLGAQIGRRETLADGLFVGEEVSEDLATIPVTRDLKTGFVIALTYKLK